jgi:hypothetical protein
MLSQLLAATSLAGFLPAVLLAQAIPLGTLRAGDRVRLTAGCMADAAPAGRLPSPDRWDRSERCARYEGAFARLTTDSVAITQGGREVTMARADVRRMHVRSGTRGNWATGAAIGAGVGFAAGLASAVTTDCSDQFLQDLCQTGQVAAPFVAGALGAGIGALLGGLIRTDRWETVSFGRRGLAIAF